jgi:tungstate transport system ATP-binding protein
VTPFLETRSLEAWHGRRRVLGPASVRIARGEVFGLYGPNGAGKTTLLQALAYLHPHAQGELLLDGMVVGRELSQREFRRRSAVVFQDCLLLRGTVLDNVALGLKLRGIDALERERRARRWLDRLRVAHLAERRAHGLSGGEAQRVSLARAFVLEPDVVFLDEPLSALDAPTRRALVDDLGGILGENGTTAVFVTHDPDELRDLCERCLILDHGTVLQTGSVKQIFDRPESLRVAEIIGADNIVTAEVTSVDELGACLDWDGESLRLPRLAAPVGGRISCILKPDAIDLRLPPATVPAGALAGTIVRTRTRGHDVLVSVRLRNGHTLRALARAGDHAVGANAILVPRPDAFWLVEPAQPAPETASPSEAGPGLRSCHR